MEKTNMTETTQKSLPKEMTIRRPGEGVKRSPDNVANSPFWVEMLLDSTTDGEPTVMRASYDPGAISHWHTHPLGQVLYILSGVALAQRESGEFVELRAGDCIWFAPDERHWHGAAPGSPMSYLSIQQALGGRYVQWMEPVSRL
jgi:quercetin dioxygenase-like cupin family protein